MVKLRFQPRVKKANWRLARHAKSTARYSTPGAPATFSVREVLLQVARNPASIYLRFVLEAIRNAHRYEDFRQGYMSRVVDCQIEPHVRVFPGSIVRGCRIGSY